MINKSCLEAVPPFNIYKVIHEPNKIGDATNKTCPP
jgi:hypothetical protein